MPETKMLNTVAPDCTYSVEIGAPDVVLSFEFPTDPAEAIRAWRTAALRAEALQADYVAARASAYLNPPDDHLINWTDGKREAHARGQTVTQLRAAQAATIEATARKYWLTHVLETSCGWEFREAGDGE